MASTHARPVTLALASRGSSCGSDSRAVAQAILNSYHLTELRSCHMSSLYVCMCVLVDGERVVHVRVAKGAVGAVMVDLIYRDRDLVS